MTEFLDMNWTVTREVVGNMSSTIEPSPWTADPHEAQSQGSAGGDYHTALGISGAADYFKFYALPVIIAVGCVSNFISFSVFVGTSLRTSSSGVYYASLAVADTVFLLTELAKWLSDKPLNLPVLTASLGFCKFAYHVRYTSLLFSAFLVTTVTVERYIAVVHPLKIATIATTKSARFVVLAEAVVCLLLGTYGSAIFELVPSRTRTVCLLVPANVIPYRMSNLVMTKVVGEIVTSVLVAVCTGNIIMTLLRSRKERSRMGTAGGDSNASKAKSAGSNSKAANSTEFQLTVMLVVVATAFVLLRAPFTVCWYVNHYLKGRLTPRLAEALRNASKVTYIISVVNYSINFFLYSLSGSRFRRHLKVMCGGAGRLEGKSAKYIQDSNSGPVAAGSLATSGTDVG